MRHPPRWDSWHDNPSYRQRDLADIAALIRGYVTEILGWDATYAKYASVMAADDFDLDEAGAYILGAEITAVLSPDVHAQTIRLIAKLHDTDNRFAGGMAEHLKISFDHALRVCNQLMTGLRR